MSLRGQDTRLQSETNLVFLILARCMSSSWRPRQPNSHCHRPARSPRSQYLKMLAVSQPPQHRLQPRLTVYPKGEQPQQRRVTLQRNPFPRHYSYSRKV